MPSQALLLSQGRTACGTACKTCSHLPVSASLLHCSSFYPQLTLRPWAFFLLSSRPKMQQPLVRCPIYVLRLSHTCLGSPSTRTELTLDCKHPLFLSKHPFGRATVVFDVPSYLGQVVDPSDQRPLVAKLTWLSVDHFLEGRPVARAFRSAFGIGPVGGELRSPRIRRVCRPSAQVQLQKVISKQPVVEAVRTRSSSQI